jgi:hypothetical protein
MTEICYGTHVCRVWGSLDTNFGHICGLVTKGTGVKLVRAQTKTRTKCLLLCEGQKPAPSTYHCSWQCSKDPL